MLHNLRASLIVAFSLAAALPAGAQESNDKYAFDVLSAVSPSSIVPKVDVVKELKLTDDQTAAVRKVLFEDAFKDNQKFYEDNKERFKKVTTDGNVSGQLAAEQNEMQWKKVKPIHSADQWTRLQELAVQSLGGRALSEKAIADKLSLNAAQRQAVLKVNNQPVINKETGAKVTFQDKENQAIKILTPKQNAEFEKLRGPKASFDILNLSKLESIPRRTEDTPRRTKSNAP